ncbi:MAG: hypothetical protein AB1529_07190 [Candidatus Micrarchaeota archaeon]
MPRKRSGSFRVRPATDPALPRTVPPPTLSDVMPRAEPLRSNVPLRLRLASQDAGERAVAAWESKLISEAGDIGDILQALPSAMRLALKPESGTAAKVYLAEALMNSAKSGADIEPALAVVPLCIEDNSLQLRNRILLALGHYCDRGGDISEYVGLLLQRLVSDIAPMNQEAALSALKSFVSQGPLKAHQVHLALGEEKQYENPDVQERVQELKDACMAALGKR